MKKFYSFTRTQDGHVYIMREGYDVPNEYGLDLAAYKSTETYEEDKYWWYVIETRSGLSISKGHTKTEAIKCMNDCVEMRGIDVIKTMIDAAVEKYGLTPDHQPTYL